MKQSAPAAFVNLITAANAIEAVFIFTCVAILLTTAAIKALGVGALNIYMALPDPLFGMLTNRTIMLLAVFVEATAAVSLLTARSRTQRMVIIALVGGVFEGYHLGLHIVGYNGVCSCLGGPNDWLHLSARQTSQIAQALIVYMLAGSYSALVVRILLGSVLQKVTIATAARPQ